MTVKRYARWQTPSPVDFSSLSLSLTPPPPKTGGGPQAGGCGVPFEADEHDWRPAGRSPKEADEDALLYGRLLQPHPAPLPEPEAGSQAQVHAAGQLPASKPLPGCRGDRVLGRRRVCVLLSKTGLGLGCHAACAVTFRFSRGY